MPPIVAAVTVLVGPLAGALGVSGITLPILAEDPTHLPQSEDFDNSEPLQIHGSLFKFGVPSTHLIISREGREEDAGTVSFFREGVEASDYLGKLHGLPIFGPNKHTLIGRITRAWIEGDYVRVEGEIRDSKTARACLSLIKCGLCIVNFMARIGTEVNTLNADEIRPECVNLTLPGQSGFRESWCKLRVEPTPLPDWKLPERLSMMSMNGW